jgi:hypothetical protein
MVHHQRMKFSRVVSGAAQATSRCASGLLLP